jgi:hypothetical protein
MRKILFMCILSIPLLVGCNNDGEDKKCWQFQMIERTTIGGKMTSVIKIKNVCYLTEFDAEKIRKELESEKITYSSWGVTIQEETIALKFERVNEHEHELY